MSIDKWEGLSIPPRWKGERRDETETGMKPVEKISDDRRARRSRRLLKQGLLEMMGQKDFRDITAREITDRADLNRGTFYLHYSSTAELLQSLEDDLEDQAQALIDAHIGEIAQAGSMRPVFEPILDFLVQNRETCGILFEHSEASGFTGRLQRLCHRNGTELLREVYPRIGQEPLGYLLNFITYGLIGLVKEWFDRDMALPKEELLAMADRLLKGIADGILGQRAE